MAARVHPLLAVALAVGALGCGVALWLSGGIGDSAPSHEQRKYLSQLRSEFDTGVVAQVDYLAGLAVAPADVDIEAQYTAARNADHRLDAALNRFEETASGEQRRDIEQFRQLMTRYRGLRAVLYGQPPPDTTYLPSEPREMEQAFADSAAGAARSIDKFSAEQDRREHPASQEILALGSLAVVLGAGTALAMAAPARGVGRTRNSGQPDPAGQSPGAATAPAAPTRNFATTGALSSIQRLTSGVTRLTDSGQSLLEAAAAAGVLAEKAATATASTVSAMREVAQLAERSAVHVDSEAAEQAAETVTVDQARGIARGTHQTVASVAAAVAAVSADVTALSRIAERTNALALNAAIEAARVGAAGRGFAVVAEEVRVLAQQASQSAKDITAGVASVTADTEQAVAAIAEVLETIERLGRQHEAIVVDMARQVAENARVRDGVARVASHGNVAAAKSTKTAAAVGAIADRAADTRRGLMDVAREASGLREMITRTADAARRSASRSQRREYPG